ncbi:unnamed protein product [Amoebophrya sp. A25]|nr:unnamed protein product [Amoebophrya sp. A25]|eukprot:GSA25T00011139001.1
MASFLWSLVASALALRTINCLHLDQSPMSRVRVTLLQLLVSYLLFSGFSSAGAFAAHLKSPRSPLPTGLVPTVSGRSTSSAWPEAAPGTQSVPHASPSDEAGEAPQRTAPAASIEGQLPQYLLTTPSLPPPPMPPIGTPQSGLLEQAAARLLPTLLAQHQNMGDLLNGGRHAATQPFLAPQQGQGSASGEPELHTTRMRSLLPGVLMECERIIQTCELALHECIRECSNDSDSIQFNAGANLPRNIRGEQPPTPQAPVQGQHQAQVATSTPVVSHGKALYTPGIQHLGSAFQQQQRNDQDRCNLQQEDPLRQLRGLSYGTGAGRIDHPGSNGGCGSSHLSSRPIELAAALPSSSASPGHFASSPTPTSGAAPPGHFPSSPTPTSGAPPSGHLHFASSPTPTSGAPPSGPLASRPELSGMMSEQVLDGVGDGSSPSLEDKRMENLIWQSPSRSSSFSTSAPSITAPTYFSRGASWEDCSLFPECASSFSFPGQQQQGDEDDDKGIIKFQENPLHSSGATAQTTPGSRSPILPAPNGTEAVGQAAAELTFKPLEASQRHHASYAEGLPGDLTQSEKEDDLLQQLLRPESADNDAENPLQVQGKHPHFSRQGDSTEKQALEFCAFEGSPKINPNYSAASSSSRTAQRHELSFIKSIPFQEASQTSWATTIRRMRNERAASNNAKNGFYGQACSSTNLATATATTRSSSGVESSLRQAAPPVSVCRQDVKRSATSSDVGGDQSDTAVRMRSAMSADVISHHQQQQGFRSSPTSGRGSKRPERRVTFEAHEERHEDDVAKSTVTPPSRGNTTTTVDLVDSSTYGRSGNPNAAVDYPPYYTITYTHQHQGPADSAIPLRKDDTSYNAIPQSDVSACMNEETATDQKCRHQSSPAEQRLAKELTSSGPLPSSETDEGVDAAFGTLIQLEELIFANAVRWSPPLDRAHTGITRLQGAYKDKSGEARGGASYKYAGLSHATPSALLNCMRDAALVGQETTPGKRSIIPRSIKIAPRRFQPANISIASDHFASLQDLTIYRHYELASTWPTMTMIVSAEDETHTLRPASDSPSEKGLIHLYVTLPQALRMALYSFLLFENEVPRKFRHKAPDGRQKRRQYSLPGLTHGNLVHIFEIALQSITEPGLAETLRQQWLPEWIDLCKGILQNANAK